MSTNSKNELNTIEGWLNDQSHHIEFNVFLTNHVKHGAIALHRLGASPQRIKEFYENYVKVTTYGFGLEPSRVSKDKVTQDNWQEYFGKHCNFTSYCEFFDQKEKELGMERLMEKYVPTLLPGCVGSLLHGTIHLGWALDSGNRWMIIEGLAYMAFSYVSCQPDKNFSTTGDIVKQKSVMDSLLYISEKWEGEELPRWQEETFAKEIYSASSGFHPELAITGFQNDIAKVLTEGHPLIHSTPDWLENLDIGSIWKELYEGLTLFYLAKPGDFLVLHLITSLYGMEQIANRLPAKQQKRAFKCYWTAMLGVVFADDEIPSRATLEKLHSQYKDAVDNKEDQNEGGSWENIVARAILDNEEHNPKLVYVQRLLWERFGHRTLFRIAADTFTTTPQVAKLESETTHEANQSC